MLTIEGLIAVISLCVACFSLGYSIGKDSKTKNNRPVCKLSGYFITTIMWTSRLWAAPFMLLCCH